MGTVRGEVEKGRSQGDDVKESKRGVEEAVRQREETDHREEEKKSEEERR